MGVAFGIVFLWMAFRGENPWARLGVCLYLFGMLASYVASTPFEMEGALAPLGPCRHLLAHSRLVLPTDAGGIAHTGLLGLVAVFVCVAVCHCRHYREFCPTERTLEHRDFLFYWNGTECARGLQTTYRLGVDGCLHLDCRRGRVLHHGSGVLFTE